MIGKIYRSELDDNGIINFENRNKFTSETTINSVIVGGAKVITTKVKTENNLIHILDSIMSITN